jgi:hypothetical protein
MIPRVARLSGIGLRALPMFLVVLALGSRAGIRVHCPAGMICAAPTFTGDEIAAMPEACLERVARMPDASVIAASTRALLRACDGGERRRRLGVSARPRAPHGARRRSCARPR